MDTGDTLIDPESEVRKLQDLVKKLEKQNEVLRSRQKQQSVSSEPVQNGDVEHGKLTINHNNNIPASLNIKNLATVSEDDNELVDIENLSVKDEEDSWLYSSPKPPTPSQNRVSPYKWVRQEFEHPSPEVESVKRSLVYKLDEAARMSRSCSTPVFGSYSTPRSYTQMSHSADSTPVYNHKPVIRKSLASTYGGNIGGGNKVDTGTFTRPKRTRPQANNVPDQEKVKPTDETDSVNHPNVSDIENLAKLQEESLRQSLSQSSPRRAPKPRQIPQAVNTVNTENDNYVANRSSPNKLEGERHLSQSNSIGSDAGSPPDSPYGSQYLNSYNNNPENPNLRRSYQNVSHLPHSPAQYGSDPYLDNYSSGGSDDYEQNMSPKPRQYSRLQPPGRPSSPSVSGLRQPSPRGASPQRSGLPQPSRGRTIPRPGGGSRISTPVRRSGLPAPRSSSYTRQDESWKEGCF